jgi:hypothetical protein
VRPVRHQASDLGKHHIRTAPSLIVLITIGNGITSA